MRVLFVMAWALLLPACASAPTSTTELDAQGNSVRPPPLGQGTLYIFRDRFAGFLVPIGVSINDRQLGFLRGYTWFRLDLAPGQYEVRCTSNVNSESKILDVAAGQYRFAEVTTRIGFPTPRCLVFESSAQEGRAGVLAGSRGVEQQAAAGTVAVPADPIRLIYRDDASNEAVLSGVARYTGVLGRDRSVTFSIENKSGEHPCFGTFSSDGPSTGKFTLSCFDGKFIGNGTYERMPGGPSNSLVARGQTPRGLPIMLTTGRAASVDRPV